MTPDSGLPMWGIGARFLFVSSSRKGMAQLEGTAQ